MRSLCVPLMLAVLVLASGEAALACGSGAENRCRLHGRNAIQFSVEDDFELSEFQGQLLSYQRYFSDGRAIRVGLGLFLDVNNEDLEVEYWGGDLSGDAEIKTWMHRGTLKVQMLFYRGKGPVYLFYGAGPKITFSDFHDEDVNYSLQGDEVVYSFIRDDRQEWGMGLQGILGVQWFINDMFALHAEYGLSAMYYFGEWTNERYYSDSPSSARRTSTEVSSPQLDSDGVQFGLSVHF